MAQVSGRNYVVTWIGLLVLTALSFSSSVLGPSPVMETVIALGIATIKASWVALVFMHLWRARFADRLAIVAAVCMLMLLVSLMLTDVLLRHTMPPKPLAAAQASAGTLLAADEAVAQAVARGDEAGGRAVVAESAPGLPDRLSQ